MDEAVAYATADPHEGTFRRLDTELDELAQRLNILEERLAPVLAPPVPEPAREMGDARGPVSGFWQQVERVKEQRERLVRLTDRIDL